jgi:hypothetical protein
MPKAPKQAAATCRCHDNEVVLTELKVLEQRNIQRGNTKLKYTLRKAMKSVRLYPLPITGAQDALLLEGVGNWLASQIDKCVSKHRPSSTTLLSEPAGAAADGAALRRQEAAAAVDAAACPASVVPTPASAPMIMPAPAPTAAAEHFGATEVLDKQVYVPSAKKGACSSMYQGANLFMHSFPTMQDPGFVYSRYTVW